jgi:cell division protein FtsZ
MTINLKKPDIRELKPKITVFGVGGGGGNAVNNMIKGGLQGVEFVVANTDAQALTMSAAERVIQLGIDVTQGLGAGSQPDVGRASAEECIDEIADHLQGTHMAFVTAGMGGGTGTGAAPVVARVARELGILTVGVVTKPFHFEGARRMKTADHGISELQKNVDTLIVIPNQNLFRIANDKTTFADAFGMADQVLYSGVACITDLMVKEGLINLDFADVRSVMREMGKAMMGTGEASGEGRAMQAAEAAIANPLLDETSMRGARGLLISITGGRDLTLFEVDEAATRIREEVDSDANIILGATFDEELQGVIRVSVVATGIDRSAQEAAGDLPQPATFNIRRSQPVTVGAGRTASPAAPVQQPVAAEVAPVMNPGQQAAHLAAQQAAAQQRAAAVAASVEQRVARTEHALAQPRTEQARPDLARAEPMRVEQAVMRSGVGIQPFRPAPQLDESSLEDDFRNALESELNPADAEPFIPAAPDMPELTAARVPDIADFPPIVQEEMDRRGATAHEERGAIGLLKTIARGFGAREHAEAPRQAQPQPAAYQAAQPAARPAAPERQAMPAQRPLAQHVPTARVDNDPFAPRRGGLDQTGRINPAERNMFDDDQLDIPAFLRRQSN